MKKISIVGLGWIGLPLANHLLSKGYEVIGSTTSAAKQAKIQEEGINAIQFELAPFPCGKGFTSLFKADVLVVMIPPRSRSQEAEFYLEQLKFLRSLIHQSPIQQVIFVSSTGIYPDLGSETAYNEDFELSLENAGNPTLLKAEQRMEIGRKFQLTHVRFGGLMGVDRIPGKYFAGKEQVAGDTKVNFIHQQDAVKMIGWIIEKELWNQIFNGVAPIHSLRKELYERNHEELGIPLPASYRPKSLDQDRLISSQRILETGFQFDFPNPINFSYQIERFK
jgi:nucleoside-diphosphate-sugar epimerase